MQKGGVVMDVTTPQQAKIAEDAGAVAVMALQAVPADIKREGVWQGWLTCLQKILSVKVQWKLREQS
jgi:pyridoxal biosynthesis lyase PdxS